MTPNRLRAAWLRGAGRLGPDPWLPGKAKQEPIEEVGDLVQDLRGAQEVLQAPKGLQKERGYRDWERRAPCLEMGASSWPGNLESGTGGSLERWKCQNDSDEGDLLG